MQRWFGSSSIHDEKVDMTLILDMEVRTKNTKENLKQVSVFTSLALKKYRFLKAPNYEKLHLLQRNKLNTDLLRLNK